MDAEARPGRPGPGAWSTVVAAAAGGLAVAVVAWAHRSTPLTAAALALVVAVSVRLAVIDLREHRLPNRIVGPLAAAVTAGLVVGGLGGGDPGRTARAVGLGLITSAVLLAGHLARGVGMGDVKYGYAAGATLGWFGLDALRLGAVATLASAGLGAALLLAGGAGRQHRFAFGPFLVAGLVAGLVLGAAGG